jgi:glycosyltransferase involved in cell wall biosynthesis
MEVKEEVITQTSAMGRYLTPSRRLRLDNWVFWPHHRSGWKHLLWLVSEHLHAPEGTRFVSAVEDEFFIKSDKYAGPIKEPWVGFIHQVPHQTHNFPDLERLVRREEWKESIEYCKGLWVLTNYQKDFLLYLDVSVPIAKVHYPTVTPAEYFSFEKFIRNKNRRLLFIGEFLRNFQAFYDLDAPDYEKTFLRSEAIDRHMQKLRVVENDSVTSLYPVENEKYDRLLSENIVFLNLFDAVGTTTVVECVASGTPILINKVGAVSEYLGEEYPFYYDTLEEATHKASDLDLIQQTAEYLRTWELKEKLTGTSFLEEIQNTSIYRSLPVPRSQQGQFKSYDVSIIICSYKRVYNLERLLTLLTAQDFEGTFEVLLWNNNIEALDEVTEICRPFEQRLSLKLMHSSQNLYCQIRMALANLIQSDLILICDDDVMPKENYISTFLKKYQEYGPKAVLCARGHIFKPHSINEEQPQRFWDTYEHMSFFDESESDRRIHFMHADNCLIPKSVMKQAAQYEMEHLEYALIDDYWLSYVLSSQMDVPIWKIKADCALEFTECADDAAIALFHNVLVNEQRVNFYISHTRQGWPPAIEAGSTLNQITHPSPAATPAATKSKRVPDCEQLASDIFDRQVIMRPSTREAFFLQLASALVHLPQVFLSEDAPSRETMGAELRELIERYHSLSLEYDNILAYLQETEQHLTFLATEPQVERIAWQGEQLEVAAHSITNLLPPDTRKYYKWLARNLGGFGEVVELGSWLGAVTSSIAKGLSSNTSFAKRRLHVYDSFLWESWMRRSIGDKLMTAHPALGALKVEEDFTNLFLEFCAPYKHFIEVRKCAVRFENDQQASLPPFDWDGMPIELFVYDFGQEYGSIKQAWNVFAPSFIPGKTVVAMNAYGNLRAEDLRRFCREYSHQLRPIHKPLGSNKGFLFTGQEV